MKVFQCKKCNTEYLDNERLKYCPDCGEALVEYENGIEKKEMNWYALAAFISSFFSSVVGIILAIVSIKDFKNNKSGKGFMIAAFIISGVKIIFSLIYIILYFLHILVIIISIINSILGGM